MDHFSNNPAELTRSRFYHAATATARPRVATSACLNGEPVRYDGASRYLPAIDALGAVVELVPVCPEVGAGLSVPRPPVQLVRTGGEAAPRALGRDDPALDVTRALTDFARDSALRLAALRVCGYVLKSRSPSCGLRSTPLFDADGAPLGTTSGIQASHCRRELPWLSYCEDTDLVDAPAAQAFALRCLLVFDWLHAGAAPLPELHRHYRFLHERFSADRQSLLDERVVADAAIAYLCELQRGCAQLPATRLLALFAG